MRKTFTLIFASLLFSAIVNAGSIGNPYERTYVKNRKETPDANKQQQLRQSTGWLEFSVKHPGWKVVFDERTGMPHRAYGAGFTLPGTDATDRARNFINGELSVFSNPLNEYKLRHAHDSKYHYVDFYQTYSGVEVLFSRITVRSTMDNRLVMFGADVFNDIQISTTPQLSSQTISAYAVNGIDFEITGITVNPDVKILPVPADGKYEYHLIYQVKVEAKDFDGLPVRYQTYVDANNGDVLYRRDEIAHNDLLTAKATISDPNPWEPTIERNLPYLRVKIAGTDYFTDATGNLSLAGITLPTTATVYLQGTWAKVFKGNTSTTPANFQTNLVAGANTVDFTPNAMTAELSAYYHVNVIHDFMKLYLPSYTQMDVSMETRVEQTSGTCNAFYDGTSINFYTHSGGCFDLALTNDVVFHEYGHGIDIRFYSANSDGLDNGAISEGYSDVWAIMKTDYPVLGIGFSDTDPGGYIRRYDINKKVYPQDIFGEVHADGEIIAGAWWDTRLNIGNVNDAMLIFSEALNGCADGPDGTEGTVFRDILLDALTADDDNGNINDGTPHDVEILSAFALHGITLIGEVILDHTEQIATITAADIPITADITLDYPIYFGSATIHYKKNTESVYATAPMNLLNGTTYIGYIPAQPAGVIIDYYFTIEDIYGSTALTDPPGVTDIAPDQNIPYVLLSGYEKVHTEDFDNFAGPWITGDPSDQANTGEWIIDVPQGTYQVDGDPQTMVQTGTDHTTDGTNTNICAVTGNDVSASDPYNTEDVDNGATTLYTPYFDLTDYTNPVISYFRWYTNEASANPRNDHWKALITNDDVTWKKVEWNNHPQRAWRDFAFHVSDYVVPNNSVRMKFIAEDSIMLGSYLDGGSIVEAGVDDLYIWDQTEQNVGVNEINPGQIGLVPNPAKDFIKISWERISQPSVVEVINAIGQIVYQTEVGVSANQITIPVAEFAAGIYSVRLISEKQVYSRKVTIEK